MHEMWDCQSEERKLLRYHDLSLRNEKFRRESIIKSFRRGIN